MINEKDKENYQKEFGKLMLRYAIICRVMSDYDKERQEITKKLDALNSEIIGVKEDGGTVCEKK